MRHSIGSGFGDNVEIMRKVLISFVCIVLSISTVDAQEKTGFDPDLAWNTIRAEYGVLIPAGTTPNQSFGLSAVSYTRRYSGRWGWRAGVQYAPLETSTGPYFGLPLSAVYRFSTQPMGGRARNAWDASLDDMSWNGGGDVPSSKKEQMRNDVAVNFLSVFLRRTEIFAGVTPGCMQGGKFTFAADAGVTLSIPLWRFSLDITPAAHYLVTRNVEPVHWVFTLSGGVSFLF